MGVGLFRGFRVCLGLLFLSACGEAVTDVMVRLPEHRVPADVASLVSSIAVDVPVFQERAGTGLLPGRVGERKTIGQVSMGEVSVTPVPGEALADVIRAELRARGARIGVAGAQARIEGRVARFDLHTDVTPLYWDVLGTVAVRVTATQDGKSATGEYQANCRERTYVWPSAVLMGAVLGRCLDEIGRQFRTDEAVRRILGS